MSWTETSPGRFERPLDDIEIFFKTISDQGIDINREHWAVSICARFQCRLTSHDTELALRNAWKAMRYDHPDIAASLADGNKKAYRVPSSVELERWMAETFHVEPLTTAENMFSESRPSPLPTLHYLPQNSEILIRSSHWRIDGIGALHLLNNFFKALARDRRASFGDEWNNLAPGLGKAANLSQYHTKGNLEAAADLMKQYTSNLPSVGLPTPLEIQVPGDTRVTRLTVSPSTSVAITSACKNRGYSVTAALHAALIGATQQFTPSDIPSKKYTSWGSVNLRPHAQSPYNSPAYPVSVYLVGFPISLHPSDFASNVTQLKSIYSRFSSPEPPFEIQACLSPYIKEAIELFSQPPSGEIPAPTEPILDSVGIADRYLQRVHGDNVEISDFWLASETLSRQLTVYVWTWREEMIFSTCYNEAFYEAVFVKEFLERVKRTLLFGLDVEADDDTM